MAKTTKIYLGDSVYLGPDQWGDNLVLTTENGLGLPNTIAMEQPVLQNLVDVLATYGYRATKLEVIE